MKSTKWMADEWPPRGKEYIMKISGELYDQARHCVKTHDDLVEACKMALHDLVEFRKDYDEDLGESLTEKALKNALKWHDDLC